MSSNLVENMAKVSPEAARLIAGMPKYYQDHLVIAVTLDGELPHIGIEMNGRILVPADPASHAACTELTRILRETEPEACLWNMHVAKLRYSRMGPPEVDDSDLIDGTVNAAPAAPYQLPPGEL